MVTGGTKLNSTDERSAKYELKVVALLALGFGLVGIDRFIINPLFPLISRDLGLDYQQLGLVSGVLALCWGISSIFAGGLADVVGRKAVIIPAVLCFSLLVSLSGFAIGFFSLLAIRALMGFAEGAYVPASIVFTTHASKSTRIGLNTGILNMAAPMFGLGLTPLLVAGLLQLVPNWRWIFGIVAIPGLIIAWLLARELKSDAPEPDSTLAKRPAAPWFNVLQYRSVTINALAAICLFSSMLILATFMPNYLTDYLKLSLPQMGIVLAGLGVGCCIGMVVLPALSDRFNRMIVSILALVMEGGCLIGLIVMDASPAKLFFLLFVIGFLNGGVISITVGPMTSQSVPIHLATSATGIVGGMGEIVGGAVAPAIAGSLAKYVGVAVVPQLALAAAIAALIVTILGNRESGAIARPLPLER